MYCPKCGYEYLPGKAGCPECEARLVETPRATRTDALEVVLDASAEVELHRAKTLLDAEGIACIVRGGGGLVAPHAAFGEQFVHWHYATHPAVGGRILVNAEDVARARKLLESLEPIRPGGHAGPTGSTEAG